MIRTVFDTNPVVAAIVNPKGYPAQLLAAWRNEEFQIIVSPVIWKKLKTYQGIRIVSPSKFYEILKKLNKG